MSMNTQTRMWIPILALLLPSVFVKDAAAGDFIDTRISFTLGDDEEAPSMFG